MGTPPPYARWYPIIAIKAQGRIGGMWIHKDYKTGKVVTKFYYPYNPRTPYQQAWRQVFADGIFAWQGFSDEVKNMYNQMTSPAARAGFWRFLRMYLNARYPPDLGG